MSFSNSAAAATATLVQHGGAIATNNNSLTQKSATSPHPHHKANNYLPNPFELHDSQILDKVYLTHVTDDQFCDTNIIFDLVSTLVLQVIYTHFLSFKQSRNTNHTTLSTRV